MGSGFSKGRSPPSGTQRPDSRQVAPAAQPGAASFGSSSRPVDSRQDLDREEGEGNEDATLAGAREALEKLDLDVEEAFRNATEEGTKPLTLNELRKVIETTHLNVSENDLLQLFTELDANGDGEISLQEWMDGLNSLPSVGSLEGMTSLLKSGSVSMAEKVAEKLLQRVSLRESQNGASSAKMDMLAVLSAVEAEDLRRALRDAEDAIVAAFTEELKELREKKESAATMAAQDFNDKFAYSGGTFEGAYLDLAEFRTGVEGSLGLPGQDVYGGIKIEFCHSEDSKDVFKTSNYGGTRTTPELEFEFVVNPDMDKDYGGAPRKPTPLEIFLYAASALRANSEDQAWDTALGGLDVDVRDGVQAVLLRRAKEVAMTVPFLAAAAATDPRLRRLSKLREERLRAMQKEMSRMFERLERRKSTGLPPFSALAEAMETQCGVAREEVEALVESMRQNLAAARMTEEEVIAVRLYSGPSFMKLNGTLRGKNVGARGNNYVCTIFAAISGMVKLAEVSPIPLGRVVYRGQRGMRLPERFWKGNALGVKGGVEMAFLSTTTDLETALNYAAEGSLPTVFAIQAGAVDKGAAIGFLSQYPHEDEHLMPPRSFLEVVGEPVLLTVNGGPVLSIPVKINCNLLCPTLEKLRAGRRSMLLAALEQVRKEVNRDVSAQLESTEVEARIKTDLFWPKPGPTGGERFVESIKEEASLALELARQRSSAWYNVDIHFRRAMRDSLEVQRKAMGKLALWVEEPTLFVSHLNAKTGHDCDRVAAGRLRRLVEEAGERAEREQTEESRSERRRVVERLCRFKELFDAEVDQVWEGETALQLHAAQGDAQAVRLLLLAHADVDLRRADGKTALMIAAEFGNVEAVKVLVSHGKADPDARDSKGGWTAVMLAAEHRQAGTIKALVTECGADARIANKEGKLPVHRAAYFGCMRSLRVLVEHGGADVKAKDNAGWNALMLSAQNGHLEVVKWLVREQGVDPNEGNGNLWTPLMSASQTGKEEVVKWLVREGGAKVNAAKSNGYTALMAAANNGFQTIVEWLVREGGADARMRLTGDSGSTTVMLAAQAGREGIVRWLVEEGGADAAEAAPDGMTCLMLAAKNGHVNVLRFLVAAAKVELDAAEANGGTALMLAASGGHLDMVKLLVSEGASVGRQHKSGWRALHFAVLAGREEVLAELKQEGAGMEGKELDAVRKEVEASRLAPFSVFVGWPSSAVISVHEHTVCFSQVCTVRSPHCCPPSRNSYFEVRVVTLPRLARLGFVSSGFQRNIASKVPTKDIGEDKCSWGVDGILNKKWFGGAKPGYDANWNEGDVVGVACGTMDGVRSIWFSVNGDYSTPNGAVFTLAEDMAEDGLYPALTGSMGVLEFNLGYAGRPFEFAPPDKTFEGVAQTSPTVSV